MSEPDNASREDLTEARNIIIERLDVMHKAAEAHYKATAAQHEAEEASMEGMRSQNSAEHGSLFTKLTHITELMHWLRARWQKFMDIPVTQNPKHPEDKD